MERGSKRKERRGKKEQLGKGGVKLKPEERRERTGEVEESKKRSQREER